MIRVGVEFLDILEVDGTNESFVADVYVWANWIDERLKYDAKKHKIEERIGIVLLADAVWHQSAQGILWNPDLELNLRHEHRKENERLIIFPDGKVEYRVRICGEFHPIAVVNDSDATELANTSDPSAAKESSAPMVECGVEADEVSNVEAMFDFTPYPFDSHYFPIQISSATYGVKEVIFCKDQKNATNDRIQARANTPDWTIEPVPKQDVYVDNFIGHHPPQFFVYRLRVHMTRKHGYYIWKVLVPVMLIVVLTWTVFWIDNKELEVQTAIVLTNFLAIIAYNFVISDDLPRVPYFTLLDSIILLSYIFVFLSGVIVVAAHFLLRVNKPELAERIAERCRWAVPATYAAMMLILFLGKAGFHPAALAYLLFFCLFIAIALFAAAYGARRFSEEKRP